MAQELFLLMNRFSAALSALLLICPVALAQGAVPTSAAVPSAASTNSAQVGTFQEIENKWSEAENKHDQFGLDLVLSPLLVNVAENGDITTHNQQVVQALNNSDKLYYLSQKVVAVRMLGDIAVVNGTYLLRHHVNQKLVTDRGVFTHVFERQHGNWKCINAQRTQVAELAPGKKAQAEEKDSSADNSPFHIPFFNRGDKK
jgi:hypothetical protein